MTAGTDLRSLLCEQWCRGASVAEGESGLRISLPMFEADGDGVTVWISPTLGGWRMTDMGTTLMRLSYDMDTDTLLAGQRARVLESILQEHGMTEAEGEFFRDVPERDLGESLLAFGQFVARVSDLRLCSRTRVASTFYDDLDMELRRIAGAQGVVREYLIPNLSNAQDYPVDFCIQAASPIFIFGVPSPEKAQLTTIVLQHLTSKQIRFESIVVPSDISAIPQRNLRRLLNAANDMVDGLDSKDDLERKVRHRMSA